MRTLLYAVAGAAALTTASLANAAITVGTKTTDLGTITISTVNNTTIPNTIDFNTNSSTGGDFTSSFQFMNNQLGYYNFALTTSTTGATIGALELLDAANHVLLTGSGTSLFTTVNLAANTWYTFQYSGTLPTNLALPGGGVGNGGTVSGNASCYAAAGAVPEPATWAMMLLGFGGIGMAMRRRRKPVLAQVA